MFLVIAIVQDYDVDKLLSTVTNVGFGATRIASTGGYLRTGNTTVLLGVETTALPRCLRMVAECCGERVDPRDAEFAPELPEYYASGLAAAAVGGGVAFVVPVSYFERVEREG